MFYAEDRDTVLKQIMPADKWRISYKDGEDLPVVAWLLFDFWSDANMDGDEDFPSKRDLIKGNYPAAVECQQIIKALLPDGSTEWMSDDDIKYEYYRET